MKKFLTTIFITMLAVVLAAMPMSGCTSECDHNVGTWEVVTAATCTTTGLRQGYCGICGNLVQEEIPVDPAAHVYGDWQMSSDSMPTASKTGRAVKVCTLCDHDDNYVIVTLPALTDPAYTSKIVTRPSAVTNGVSQYTYPTDYGDVVFNVEIGSEGIQTVTDAVGVSTMDESHDMVRYATGSRSSKYYEYANSENNTDWTTANFSYELYETYTHILADDSSEFWVGYDGDEIYGYKEDEKGNFTTLSDTNFINGYQYYEAYTENLSYYYGTENFLSGVYAFAKNNANGDLTESITQKSGETVYSFSFGTYIVFSGGTRGARFSVITVSFTLTSSYTIKWLEYYSDIYENDSTLHVYNEETSAYEWSSDAPFNFDEDGNAYVVNSDGPHYSEKIEVTQTLKSELEPGDDYYEELTNPYTPDTRFYTDFDVTYNGEVISGDTGIELVAGTTSGYDFSVTNFAPDDNILGDTITFYYKQLVGGSYEYTEININTEASVGIFVHLNDKNNFCIKSNIADTITIAVCSRNVTKEFTITFTSNAPSALYPTVYEFKSATGYVENMSSSSSNSAEVYVGQPLYYKTSLSEAEAGSCTESYETTVTYTGSTDDYTVNDSTSVYIDSSAEYIPTSSFTAYKTGTYVLTLTSTEDSSIKCTITVTVVDAPSLDSLFTGTKTGTFSLTGKDVSVTFGEITKTQVSYTAADGSTAAAYKCTVTATVDYFGSTQVLCTYYTSLDGATVYNVSFTQIYNAEDMVSSEMLSTALSDEYYFTISLNEAFCITVTHTLTDEVYEGANETAVLK